MLLILIKQSNWEKGLGKPVTRTLMVILAELQRSCMEMRETSRRTTISSTLTRLCVREHKAPVLLVAGKANKRFSGCEKQDALMKPRLKSSAWIPSILPEKLQALGGGVMSLVWNKWQVRVEKWSPPWISDLGPERQGPQTELIVHLYLPKHFVVKTPLKVFRSDNILQLQNWWKCNYYNTTYFF